MDEKVLNIIAKIAKKDVAVLRQNMDAAGLWDSFSHVEMIVMLEGDFGVFFEQDEIAQMKTPNSVIEHLRKKVSG